MIVWLVMPGAKFSVPLVPVKSRPAAVALCLAVLLAPSPFGAEPFPRATPESVGLNPAKLQEATDLLNRSAEVALEPHGIRNVQAIRTRLEAVVVGEVAALIEI